MKSSGKMIILKSLHMFKYEKENKNLIKINQL